MRAVLVAVLCLAACKDHPSKLDEALGNGSNSVANVDPWDAISSTTKKDGDTRSDDSGSGFDVQAILEKIKTAIDTPGPYESPKHSKDYDAETPHWGVM